MRVARYAGVLLLGLVYWSASRGDAASAAGGTTHPTRQQLQGAWRLVSIDVSGPKGPLPDPFYQPGSVGIIVYDPSGSMSVQIAGPRRVAWKSPASRSSDNTKQDAELKAAAFDTYYAYFGTWSLNETTSVVTHQVTASLIPAETGTHYAQTVSIDGGRLTLISVDSTQGIPIVRKKVWERIADALSAGHAPQ